jgi:hypothetical protein
MTRFSDRTIVLVKHFTVVEDLPHVQTELVFGLVTNVVQFLLNRRQIHWSFDDLLVRGKLLRVHWKQKRPCVIVTFEIFQNRFARCEFFK